MLYTLTGLHRFSHYTNSIIVVLFIPNIPMFLTAAYLRVDFLQNFGLLLVIVSGYLTIISRARMGSESIAHEAEGRMGY